MHTETQAYSSSQSSSDAVKTQDRKQAMGSSFSAIILGLQLYNLQQQWVCYWHGESFQLTLQGVQGLNCWEKTTRWVKEKLNYSVNLIQ